MIDAFIARLRQGKRTVPFPIDNPPLPRRFRGLPAVDRTACPERCAQCAENCPTGAIGMTPDALTIDLGRCLFCTECESACPNGALTFSHNHRLASTSRDGLHVYGRDMAPTIEQMAESLHRILGRSLKLREVSAGGCNGCEAEANALSNVIYDVSRFGIEFTASPRHADGLFVTGPVTANMREALIAAYTAVADPKIVIAAGACAISGGPYIGHTEANDGIGDLIPVDLYIPGCPPHPYTLLDGIYRFLKGIN